MNKISKKHLENIKPDAFSFYVILNKCMVIIMLRIRHVEAKIGLDITYKIYSFQISKKISEKYRIIWKIVCIYAII